MSVRVSFVIVSHSASLATGVCELAAQMAPDVHFEAAAAAVEGEGSGVIVLTDLGSATMTVESVIDMCDEPERVRFVDTCLVEGAVASSVPPAASKCTSGAIWAASSQTPAAREAEWETMR